MARLDGPAGRGDPARGELDAPEAVRGHYRSVDSAPAAYALDQPPRVVNGCLLTFVAVSLLMLLVFTVLLETGLAPQGLDVVFYASGGDRASIPVRVFILCFFLAFSLYISANVWRRLSVLVWLWGGLLVASGVIDTLAFALDALTTWTVSVAFQQVLAAIVGLALFPVVLLRQARLPAPIRALHVARVPWTAWVRLLVPLALAIMIAVLASQRFEQIVWTMREFALLGGVGPGVFLVQQALVLIAFGVGTVLVVRSRRAAFSPPLALLVPAQNEAHLIGTTIAALDAAAAAYGGPVSLYVVENQSVDDTAGVAQRAIDRAQHLSGTLLRSPGPGKARALNHGLARISEPFVVRVDADAVLDERALDIAMRHFADERVGVVGGLPLPDGADSYFDRVRLVEVLVRHGYFQVARMGFDGIVGVPGMFSVFRRSALDEAGPIVQGMNGEDTDICMRLTSRGYRCLVDPRVLYTTETPQTWAHLREQRTRWFRSTYHVAAHNRHVMLRGDSMAGTVVLPFALLNAARRALLAPVLMFGVLVLIVFPTAFAGLRWQPLAAMVIGLPALVSIAVCLIRGRPRAVLYVPEYLVFRIIRSYFTLAAVLSLRFDPLTPPWRRPG